MFSLWSTLGGKVAERYSELLLSPALGFWFGGMLAYAYARGWRSVADFWMTDLGEASIVIQVSVAVGALLLVAGSAKVVEWFTPPMLRLLEGYWPARADRIASWLVGRRRRRIDRDAAKWRDLYRCRETHTVSEAREFRRINTRRSMVPPSPGDRMPTGVGDVLRAMEARPRHRYGLDAVICFPHLWSVLPEHVRADLAGARRQVDDATRLICWSILFSVWMPLAWWALIPAALGALVGYRSALASAQELSTLVQSAFDLYRGLLYDAVGAERPKSHKAELAAGTALTAWFERGYDPR
ncbi:hypothetical protein GCM10028784_25860 [Myceligenerans cantabricum]